MDKQYTKIVRNAKFYFKDPEKTILHRTDGPAIEYAVGTKKWWLNGMLHRMDGPAVEQGEGIKTWWVNGVFMFEVNKEGNIVDRMK